MRKLRVLFVAGLDSVAEGGAGGQLAAAGHLFRSPLAEAVDLVPISSTQRAVPPPPVPVRAYYAGLRLAKLLMHLPRADVALVFVSDGFGLIEKGLFCLLARLVGKGVVLRIGSGRIPEMAQGLLWRVWLRRVLASAHVICSQGRSWTVYFESFREARGKMLEAPNGVSIPHAVDVTSGGGGNATISFVGHITRDKGVFEAVEAFRVVHARWPRAVFLLAGDGPDISRLQAVARSAGLDDSVRFLGWLSPTEIGQLLRRTDVFFLPSHFEGMPNALLEAMAAGVPVVATPVGAIRDLIRDEYDGCLAPVGDVAAMARHVCRLLLEPDLARRIGQQGRQRVAEEHDIQKVWRIFLDAVRGAAAAAGRPVPPPSGERPCRADEATACADMAGPSRGGYVGATSGSAGQMDALELKQRVREHWEREVCGSRWGADVVHDRKRFFDEIERTRYIEEYMLPDFADFPGARGKRVLEVGPGAGTDFIQWARNGAMVAGRDLTSASVELVRERLQLEGLAADVARGDAEALEFPDGTFDLYYSWGVLMCAPDTEKAISEAHRVLKSGGTLKIMLYKYPSISATLVWLLYGVRRLDFRHPQRVIAENVESPNTKFFTIEQARAMVRRVFQTDDVDIRTYLGSGDLLTHVFSAKYQGWKWRMVKKIYPRWFVRHVLGHRVGTVMTIHAVKR